MNKQESDVLNVLLLEPFINQRILAEVSGHSLGVVNRSIKELIKADYLDESIRPTMKAIMEFKQKKPQRAVILAAGFGMRMVPINTEMPKGLLEVNGEPLIERIIKQLHEVGIKEIYVVVGFMKEKYEYLIDEYGVELLVNADYAAKNNLHSVKLVIEHLENGKHICDDIAYINPQNGYKITEFLEGARVCDPLNYEDVKKCMKRLHAFHDLKLKVNHEFDIFGQMEFYETLWEGTPSVYKDYEKTKANVLSLKPYIDAHVGEKVLTHIDAVPDNFLFVEKDGREEIRLIDWEYAGMQDPHVDVAMFCIYSLYNKRQVDRLIAAYFTEGCSDETRIKIYCYIAACGLLWSNWCEYKRNLGVEFGEYSLRQYRYAKDYYRIVQEELKKQREEE